MQSFLPLFHRGVLIVLSFEPLRGQAFCKYEINPYLQPLNQLTNQPINDICQCLIRKELGIQNIRFRDIEMEAETIYV